MKKKVFVLWSVLLCLAFANTINGKSGGDNDGTQNYVFVDSMKNSEEGNAGGDCNLSRYDLRLYVHNAVERWAPFNGEANIGAGGYFGNIDFGANSNVSGSVLIPICAPFRCNICEKKHLDKPFKYL